MKLQRRYLLLALFLAACVLFYRYFRLRLHPQHPPVMKSYISREELFNLANTLPSKEFLLDNSRCRMETCFDFDKCQQFKVYIYPNTENLIVSNSYQNILQSIRDSGYYTENPDEACLFVLSIDTLDRDSLSQDYIRNMQYRVDSLDHWNGGQNHLIFNLYSGTFPNYTEDLGFDIGKALLAKASIATENYRPSFDISLPLFHKTHPDRGGDPGLLRDAIFPGNQQYFLAFKGKRYVYGIGSETRNSLYHLHNKKDLALVTTCKHGKNWQDMQDERCAEDNEEYDKWDYTNLLTNSTFCLVPRGRRLGSFRFLETLQAGCVPVIMSNGWQLPFGEVIDWPAATIAMDERLLLQAPEILRTIPQPQIFKLRQQTQAIWDMYLSSVRKIVMTTLEIIRQRINPHLAASIAEWNNRPGVLYYDKTPRDLFRTCAVINMAPIQELAGNEEFNFEDGREEALVSSNSNVFKLIQMLGSQHFITEIVIVWRSKTSPPPLEDWQRFGSLRRKKVELTVVVGNSTVDKFQVISDNCKSDTTILLNDDVILNSEELLFMHNIYKDFSDRIVGFTPRIHYWDGEEKTWRYSSKASHKFSMISTEAAIFATKYSRIFYQVLPLKTIQYLKQFGHCQDILFNMLVSTITRTAPVKVAERSRLSGAEFLTFTKEELATKFAEKQDCMNRFAEDLGEMPLVVSQVRFDPTLYKDSVSAKRKKYKRMETFPVSYG